MKRDPSLHVRKSDLIKIIQNLSTSRKTAKEIADEIFSAASPYQIKTRYLKVMNANAKVKKKAEKSMQADEDVPDGLVETFNLLLTTIRKKLFPYAKIAPITKNSKDYLLLKEVAKNAHEFAEHFDIVPKRDGYEEYIRIGMEKMSKYGLNRFKYYHNKIVEHFQNKVEIIQDDKRADTMEFYSAWQTVMLENSGLSEVIDIENNYDKFIHILYGRKEADKYEADYAFWIEAQFSELAFLNALPELSQFYGEGAYNRFERHLKKSINYEETKADSDTGDYYDR